MFVRVKGKDIFYGDIRENLWIPISILLDKGLDKWFQL